MVIPNTGTKCRWGKLNAGEVAENGQLSARSVVNLAWSQIYHTERPPYVFAASCVLWCSALRRFVSDSWPCQAYLQLSIKCRALLQLLAAIWPVIAVVVTSSFRISKPNRGFLSKSEPIARFLRETKPNWTSKIKSADPYYWQYTMSQKKTSHLWLAITLTHMNRFWYLLVEMLLLK